MENKQEIRRTLWFNKEVQKVGDYGTPISEQHYYPASLDEANLVGSLGTDELHYPVIDLDFPVRLVESSTPGHYHLYLDVGIDWSKYHKLLQGFYLAGLIQPLWYENALDKGCSFVRPPWLKKGDKPKVEMTEFPALPEPKVVKAKITNAEELKAALISIGLAAGSVPKSPVLKVHNTMTAPDGGFCYWDDALGCWFSKDILEYIGYACNDKMAVAQPKSLATQMKATKAKFINEELIDDSSTEGENVPF